MSEEAAPESHKTESSTVENRPLLKRISTLLKSSRWLAVLVIGTIVVQFAGFWYVGRLLTADPTTALHEIELGRYSYDSDASPQSTIETAAFDLHVRLIEELDGVARTRLEARRFKVQQDIEQLLRLAHSGDFEDPTLAELKRQLQEQINESLEMRAISEVIITNLDLERGENTEMLGRTKPRPTVETGDRQYVLGSTLER